MGASAPMFSVFPPPANVPRIAMPDPHNRKPSLSSNILTASAKDAIIIQITQPPLPPIPAIQKSWIPTPRRRQTPSPDGAKTLVNSSPDIRNKSIDEVHDSIKQQSTSLDNLFCPEPAKLESTSTLGNTVPITGRKSPVVPIRSMFPVYNPSVTLAEQQYYPQRPAQAYVPVIPISRFSPRQELKDQLASPIDRQLGSRTAPQSMIDIPFDAASVKGQSFSSPRSLERLWDASYGAEPRADLGSFDLQLGRASEATFILGSSPDIPLYTITTYDTNEISVVKTCPRKRTVTCDVALFSIEPVERRLPQNDGLVAYIFPKTAAMLAISQSEALAHEHDLATAERNEIQEAAIQRAAEQEAASLRYNYGARRYEFDHPAIARRAQDLNLTNPPGTTDGVSAGKPCLHITVHQSRPQTMHGKPIIIVTTPFTELSGLTDSSDLSLPNQTRAFGDDANLRLSTVNNAEEEITSEEQLASLDLDTNTLHIDAYRVLTVMPSLFAIDSIISAVTAVAVADHATNVVMGAMPIWVPAPRQLNLDTFSGTVMSWGMSTGHGDSARTGIARPHTQDTGLQASSLSKSAPTGIGSLGAILTGDIGTGDASKPQGIFFATFAEREDAETEARQQRKEFQKDIKTRKSLPKTGGQRSMRTWFGRTSEKKNDEERQALKRQKKHKQIMVEEFDLEKMGHYQDGTREGQELPGVTRMLLSALVGGLKLIIWILTCLVRLLAWLLVNGTRCVTSERF